MAVGADVGALPRFEGPQGCTQGGGILIRARLSHYCTRHSYLCLGSPPLVIKIVAILQFFWCPPSRSALCSARPRSRRQNPTFFPFPSSGVVGAARRPGAPPRLGVSLLRVLPSPAPGLETYLLSLPSPPASKRNCNSQLPRPAPTWSKTIAVYLSHPHVASSPPISIAFDVLSPFFSVVDLLGWANL